MKTVQPTTHSKQRAAAPRLPWQTRWLLAAKAAASIVLLGTSPENQEQSSHLYRGA